MVTSGYLWGPVVAAHGLHLISLDPHLIPLDTLGDTGAVQSVLAGTLLGDSLAGCLRGTHLEWKRGLKLYG